MQSAKGYLQPQVKLGIQLKVNSQKNNQSKKSV